MNMAHNAASRKLEKAGYTTCLSCFTNGKSPKYLNVGYQNSNQITSLLITNGSVDGDAVAKLIKEAR